MLMFKGLLMWGARINFFLFVTLFAEILHLRFLLHSPSTVHTIWFLALDQYHHMSLTQFSIMLGLYDRDYIGTEEYE